MFATFVSLLTCMTVSASLASPGVGVAVTCFGPCVVPDCPNSKFWVCHESVGSTKIYAESQSGATSMTTQSNSSTFSLRLFGAQVQPAVGETWGSVSSCGDVLGGC